MEQELKKFTEQDILEKIKRLEPQQVAEVVDFIEFLAERNRKGSPLVRFLTQTSGSRVGLEEVRRRLAKIQGKMSDAVRELRDERGMKRRGSQVITYIYCADRPFAALIREEGFSVINPEEPSETEGRVEN